LNLDYTGLYTPVYLLLKICQHVMTDWSIYKYTIMNAKATTKLRNNTMSRT